MRIVWQSVLSMALGFLGGIIAMRVEPHLHTKGVPTIVHARTVRAERFELEGPTGSVLAYWGHDWQRGLVLIAFLDEKEQPRAEFGVERQVASSTAASSSPFTAMIGSDGGIRIQQRLDGSQNPVLMMGDSASENRLMLGHW